MSDIDPLFEVRNNYYIGAFQQCINGAQNARVKTENEVISKDVFLYRAYISLKKFSIPLTEIDRTKASASLRSIRRFAEYVSDSNNRTRIASEVMTELESDQIEKDDISVMMAALIMLQEDNVEEALRILRKGQSLECLATSVQCFLKMHRLDLAIKALKKLQDIDEDSTITQFALAWVNMAAGKEKLKEAFYIYQEMIDKYGPTPTLLVSKAVCLIQQAKYDEAEKVLQDAVQRDPGNADAVVGLMVTSMYLGRSTEITNRHINQMKQEFPTHPWTKDYLEKEREFERLI